jgi:hypothetical protein
VAVAGLEPLFAAGGADVAFSALAATAADFAVGTAAVPVAADDGALAFTAGIAVAYALNGIADHATLALPSAHAT